MKFKYRIEALIILAILLIVYNDSAYSQVVVEKSKDKVIISGVPYYIHQVKKGETAYSISKAYGISVEDIAKENPSAVYGVKEGQSLRIPVKQISAEQANTGVPPRNQQLDESKFIYHNLQRGETVYSLSKSFGVSENEIIQSNPGIDINKLSIGSLIAIPRKEFMTDRQKFDDQGKKYIYHKVLKGESLSSIARLYGFTVRELRKENRDLRFPQVGDYVKVPDLRTAADMPVAAIKSDTVAEVKEEPEETYVRPAGYTPVKDLRGSLDVAVLLPFYTRENSGRTDIDSSKTIKGKKQYKVTKKAEEWIYKDSYDFIELYNGILLAADTLRSLGLDINLFTYDIKGDTSGITKLITSGKLSGMDLIIGPVYSHNLSIVAAYGRDLGIPVVSPVSLMNNSVLSGNRTLFMASSSLEIVQKALAKSISESYDNNLVFIHADTSHTDEDVKRFKNLIFKELTYKMPYEDIKFKEIAFYSRSMFDNDSINRLSHALSDRSKNIVIIASEDAPVISETITDLRGLSKKFNIRVFGYPSMLEIENLEPKVFFDLDQMVFTPYYIDYTSNDVKCFNSSIQKKIPD